MPRILRGVCVIHVTGHTRAGHMSSPRVSPGGAGPAPPFMLPTPGPLREGLPMKASRLLVLATLSVAVISCRADDLGSALLSGDWGGPHAALSAAADGATLQFDCGRGSITVPVQLDAQGRFDLAGVYVAQPAGPVAPGDSGEAARYGSVVSGRQLQPTMTLPPTGAPQGPVLVILGTAPQLVPCS